MSANSKSDSVNHPAHYNTGQIEVIDVIADQGFAEGFCIGNAIKYICRANHKHNALEDLRKARWYLDWYIRRLEALEKQEGGL